ncbi:MAG TPA: ester cyclase [Pseudonocardiaceae bacterium]|jgi:ketosteroid isomerase-like protein|nr:ester cyclase [Pseudonocardiaceae bacterium]
MGQAADAMHRKIAAFNAQDGKEFQELMGPDIEWAIPGALLRGPDQVAAFNSALWKEFPDIKLTATRVAQDGAIVVMQGRAEGTHHGTFHTPGGDIPPTGKCVNLPYSEYIEVGGNVIASARLVFDRLGLLEQLGVAPAPARA